MILIVKPPRRIKRDVRKRNCTIITICPDRIPVLEFQKPGAMLVSDLWIVHNCGVNEI